MNVKSNSILGMAAALVWTAMLASCGTSQNKSPDVTSQIRQNLDQAGFKDVKVDQDRDKGVVTLSGNVTTDSEKSQAESIAKSVAGSQVVADQISVRPVGEESAAKKIDSALDDGIDKNLKAALLKNKLSHDVNYKVKNGVVTLTGTVNSQARRNKVEKIAAAVPNVQQVVNELQIRDQKAESSSD
jgi:hyperosmotically inducible periplasmic protein